MATEKRLIDANALLEKIQYRLPFKDMVAELINEIVEITRKQIADTPTVDAVEVVRCRDCKYAYINSFSAKRDKALCNRWCNNDGNNALMQGNDFCSYGERKDDG